MNYEKLFLSLSSMLYKCRVSVTKNVWDYKPETAIIVNWNHIKAILEHNDLTQWHPNMKIEDMNLTFNNFLYVYIILETLQCNNSNDNSVWHSTTKENQQTQQLQSIEYNINSYCVIILYSCILSIIISSCYFLW